MKYTFRSIYYLRHYWPTALGGGAALLVVNASNLLTPQLLRWLIDQGIAPLNLRRVWLIAAFLVGVAFVRGVANFLQAYWAEITSQGVAYDLRNAIFAKLQKLSFSYHDQVQTGKLMTRMTSDVELVRMFVGTGLLQLISALILLFGTIVIMSAMNWRLTVVVLLTVPVIVIILGLFVKQIMPASLRVQQKLSELNTILQENLAGVRVVKGFAREDYERERFLRQNDRLLEENLGLVKLFTNLFPLVFFVANLGLVAVIGFGGFQVIGGEMSLGELVAFTGYLGFLLMPMFMMGMIGAMMSRAEASAQRIFEVIDARADVQDRPGAKDISNVQGQVKFEQVCFRYIGAEQNVLKNISFTAQPGQKIALLGKTGSGKSTIINLIPRFYDVTDGRVLLDGEDVRDLKMDQLRQQIGIVLQETTLFSGTIRENIAFGRLEASIEEVERAARAAQAHDFIAALPEGYQTLVGERGVGLSGGQKQRIAIARALLVDPKILIMDDSTSAVDAETEFRIQEALEQLMVGRTSFIIAQRISTVRDADQILLLEDGELLIAGTHEELLRSSEEYVNILESQFGAQALQSVELVEEVLQ